MTTESEPPVLAPEDRSLLVRLLIGVAVLCTLTLIGSVYSVIEAHKVSSCLIESSDAVAARGAFTNGLDELTRQQNDVIIKSARGQLTREKALEEYSRIQGEREELQDKRDRFRVRPVRECV